MLFRNMRAQKENWVAKIRSQDWQTTGKLQIFLKNSKYDRFSASKLKKIYTFEKIIFLMKLSLSFKSVLLALLFILSSCATTEYSNNVAANNYTNLKSGRPYTFTLNNGAKKQKMYFFQTKGDSIYGFKSKKDSTVVALSKASVTSAKDLRKASLSTAAIAIGAAGAAAIIISSSRATHN